MTPLYRAGFLWQILRLMYHAYWTPLREHPTRISFFKATCICENVMVFTYVASVKSSRLQLSNLTGGGGTFSYLLQVI
ncbi:hypothetical protein GDO78_015071 [Eleutherodactylus coqui]|uniref:Uncharacterized protein n=1 Tax=Eleutherodactylus coqui TaxID=57060 RepID=A0A8J6JPG6_ELECQ|nr:hypothetical protein GDO78_015071 [Eleutherodactylus coqui]